MKHPIPDAALDGDIAILGRKGGGKTYTAKGIVERLLDMGRRVLVLDPLGVWPGLRTAADGERPGYPIAIFGGQHADLPLDTAAAVAMADVLARENVPAVVDLSDLSKTAQQSFLLAFLHELRRVNQEALTIVLEEADVFAPQQPMGDDSKQLHSEIDWIARRGRFKGFRLVTVTQRPARLSKDVLTQCSTLIAHKLPAPQDRDAVKAWVEGNGDRDLARQVFDTLAGLEVGQAWVWSPEHDLLNKVRFPAIKTLDTSATPKAGEQRIEPKTLAQVDLTPIRAALEAAKATESKPTRKRVDAAPDPQALEEAERLGFERGYAAALANTRDVVGHFDTSLKSVEIAVVANRAMIQRFADRYSGDLARQAANYLEAERHIRSGSPAVMPSAAAPTRAAPPSRPVTHARPSPAGRGDGASPSKGEPAGRKLLGALARYAGRPLSWMEVCIAAGMLHGNGYFYGGRKWLLESGYAVEDGRGALITPEGVRAAGGQSEPLTLAQIIALWAPKVRAPAPLMLDQIAERRPRPVYSEELASAINLKPGNGYWYGGIAAIREPGLIVQDDNSFALSDFLKAAP